MHLTAFAGFVSAKDRVCLAPLSKGSRSMRYRSILLLLFFFLTSNVFAKQSIIIDTDMAIDDWMAILYLLNKPNVEVKGITVTGTGEAHCAPGIENALKLVNLSKHAPIPIACGRVYTDAFGTPFPLPWREQADALMNISLPTSKAKHTVATNESATSLLKRLIYESKEKPAILALGPLTNLADAFRETPHLTERISQIYIMGGAVRTAGNVHFVDPSNQVAEWNLFADPMSARIVLQSGAPITLVPLDATNAAPLDTTFAERLAADHKHPVADFVWKIVQRRMEFVHVKWYFWDPLAAAVAADESFAHIESLPIEVLIAPHGVAGQTRIATNGNWVRVALDAQGTRFQKDFIDTINGRT